MKKICLLLCCGLLLSSCGNRLMQLRVVETTDLHAHMMDYDYHKDKPTEKYGLVRTASLIKQLRAEVDNSVLVDNGDLIQGSPLGDFIVDRGLSKADIHPIFKAMNQLQYDVGNIGNHEFNFGLEFLQAAVDGAEFPYICANVFEATSNQPLFQAYHLKPYQFTDNRGNLQTLTVAYIGFVPPQIMTWDRQHLQGKVKVKDMVEVARQLLPKIRQQGADVVIAIPHSGLTTEPHQKMAENAVYELTKVKGIDAIAFGHSHSIFPSSRFAGLSGVDIKRGTINGIAAVMPGYWGSHVGVIDLTLSKQSGNWKVIDSTATAVPIYDQQQQQALVIADQATKQILTTAHHQTRDFVNREIGYTDVPLHSYLSLLQDNAGIQLINTAQREYLSKQLSQDVKLKQLPILSAAAPFKTGGWKNDPENYTEINAGKLTFRSASDLYLYPNTLVALKVNGTEIKEWLECSAGLFNQLNPHSDKPQQLINWKGFYSYNFDIIDGVNYQIDLTQPARYDKNCRLANPEAQRIIALTFKGKAINPKQQFIVASNNYRAYNGKFSGTGNDHIVFSSSTEIRQILSNYISQITAKQGKISLKADHNWRFKPIANSQLKIRFETSAAPKAAQFISQNSIYPIQLIKTDQQGFAVYQVDLSHQP